MKLKKKVTEEKNVEKIVVLNSGGFDSIVLMNCIYKTQPDAEIHSIHFHYGARNEKQQQACVDKVCKKCSAKNVVINLPKFDWTSSDFYGDSYDYKSQYLEYRNLVFLSYAISYAESIGAKKIYLAILKDGNYSDTNPAFIKAVNSITSLNNIEVITPFSDMYKDDLLEYAIPCHVIPGDYFSCDVPNEDGSPCGKCLDCCSLEPINNVLKVDYPLKAFYHSGYDFSDKTFKKLLSEMPLFEVRALINNDCQLKCKHCFYGFDKMVSDPVTKEEYYNTLKELVLKYHCKNIHFSGKEPLFDDSIMWYIEQIKKDNLPCTFNIVTNGINVPKYAKQLKKYGIERIFLSTDDILNTNGVRSVHDVTDKALKACNKEKIPVEIFIDIHENNYNRVGDIISYLEKNYKIARYFIRTIRSIGNAKNQNVLDGLKLNYVWEQLEKCASKYKNKEFEFNLGIEYQSIIVGTHLEECINFCEDTFNPLYTNNLMVKLEEYCSRYSGTLTFTPDGYFLGCASEVSCPNYDKTCVGNIRDHSVDELMELARKESYKANDHYVGCSDLKCSCEYLCKTIE